MAIKLKKFSNDKVIEVNSVRDLLDKSEKNVIDRLKKEFKSKFSSSMTLKFSTGWYWHIFIYHDMHMMKIGLVKTKSEQWPSQDEWENNSRHLEMDDRYSKDQLIDQFLDWVE